MSGASLRRYDWSSRATRAVAALTLAGLLLFCAACEELGNAPRGVGSTRDEVWARGNLTLVTRTTSVPAKRISELLGARGSASLHHIDRSTARANVATLVEVRIQAPAGMVPPRWVLMTRFIAKDGGRLDRTWVAPGGERRLRGLFLLPAAPASVTTALHPSL